MPRPWTMMEVARTKRVESTYIMRMSQIANGRIRQFLIQDVRLAVCSQAAMLMMKLGLKDLLKQIDSTPKVLICRMTLTICPGAGTTAGT